MKVTDTRYKKLVKTINWRTDFESDSIKYKIMMAIQNHPDSRSSEIANIINKNTNNIRSTITILITRGYVIVKGGGLFVT